MASLQQSLDTAEQLGLDDVDVEALSPYVIVEGAYSYLPLATPSSIRLIRISPDRVGKNITCTIHQFNEDNCPKFSALSYYWGDPTPTRTIFLGNLSERMHLCHLHENLWSFLESAREGKPFVTYL